MESGEWHGETAFKFRIIKLEFGNKHELLKKPRTRKERVTGKKVEVKHRWHMFLTLNHD